MYRNPSKNIRVFAAALSETNYIHLNSVCQSINMMLKFLYRQFFYYYFLVVLYYFCDTGSIVPDLKHQLLIILIELFGMELVVVVGVCAVLSTILHGSSGSCHN